MIAFLRGILHVINGEAVILDVNGVGYLIQVPLSTVSCLPSPGNEVMLHTTLSVREDSLSLYGFESIEALEVFRLLISVSGVGPRAALNLLSAITPNSLVIAVKEENIDLLIRAPGIGKKSAQRIILELKDKIKNVENPANMEVILGNRQKNAADAIEALTILGFTMPQAIMAVEKAEKELGPEKPTAEVVRLSFKYLTGSG